MTDQTLPLREGIQDLTYDQRSTWGWCPVCQAKNGEPCRRSAGFFAVTSTLPQEPHQERLDRAPARVRIEVLP